MAGEGVCRGAGAQVHKADGWVLRGARDKEMLSYRGQGVRIDIGVEVEGSGASESGRVMQL